MSTAEAHTFEQKARTALGACFLTAMLVPGIAFADVRLADEVLGSTVEALDLSVAECPSIDAEHAVLVSQDGTVLFARGGNDPAQIASITKVMTAIVAIDNAPLDTRVTVSYAAATIGESSANLWEGDQMDLESALKALLVPSGNDAAVAIAETVGQLMIDENPLLGNDPVTVFVQAMNAKAEQLGCTDTIYENPHGLDDEIYAGRLHSTAADQAKVAQCAMGYQLIRDIVGGGSTAIAVMREGEKVTVELETTDALLEMYDSAIGVKTGVTDLAGPSFMGAASKEGTELYAVVLDSVDEMTRFVDARTMFEWAYDHMMTVQLANVDETMPMTLDGSVREVPVVAAVSHADYNDRTVRATITDPDAAVTVFDLQGNVSQTFEFDELHGDVKAGQKVGNVVYRQRNAVVAEQALIACEDVNGPGFIESLGVWWDRTVGSQQARASQVYNVMPLINNNVSAAA